MLTYKEFLVEARKRAPQIASKRGKVSKPGLKSGKSEAPLDIKMAGMPGSGKSTMAKKLARATGGIATGYDDARETIHGNRSNQGDFPKVHKLTMDRLRNADRTKPRIQDNTNVNKKYTKSTDDALRKEADFRKITTVSPDTDQRASFRRNSRRENPVPKFVMRQHMAPGEREFKRSNEGKEAVRVGRDLSKRFRLNRRSVGSRLGVERKRGKE